MTMFEMIEPGDFARRYDDDNGVKLIDVRNFDEFERVHVRGARCVPLEQVLKSATDWPHDDELVLICHSGQRAREAGRKLHAVGFTRLAVVDGGTQACVSHGLPVERSTNRLPLQRQVLIGTGIVLLIGLALGTMLHPVFTLITWLTSAMVIVAGLTGFCPMARMLAAASWNRAPAVSNGAASRCVVPTGETV